MAIFFSPNESTGTMPPKKKRSSSGSAGSPSRVKKKSNTKRAQDSRKNENEKVYDKFCRKSFLVVVENDSNQLPELILKGPDEHLTDDDLLDENCTKGDKGHFHHSHTYKARVDFGPLANRDVLQVLGLTMPGVTVIDAPPVPPASDDEQAAEQAAAASPPRRGVPRFPSTQRMTRRQERERDELLENLQLEQAESDAPPAGDDSGRNSLFFVEPDLYHSFFCDAVGLSASKYAAPPPEEEDIAAQIEAQMKALADYKTQSVDADFPTVLDYRVHRDEEDWKLENLISNRALLKRGEDLDTAYEALMENNAYDRLGGHSAKRPPNPCLYYKFIPDADMREKAPPASTTGDLIMNMGHFVGFDVVEKLKNYLREPEKQTSWLGNSAEWKNQVYSADNPTPKIHFCTYKSLHSAIQCNPVALKHFLSANFNQVIWFGSGHTLCLPSSSESPTANYNEFSERTMRDTMYSWCAQLFFESSIVSYPTLENIHFFKRYGILSLSGCLPMVF